MDAIQVPLKNSTVNFTLNIHHFFFLDKLTLGILRILRFAFTFLQAMWMLILLGWLFLPVYMACGVCVQKFAECH